MVSPLMVGGVIDSSIPFPLLVGYHAKFGGFVSNGMTYIGIPKKSSL